MTEITNKMTETAYLYSKKVYADEMAKKDALLKIHEESGMSKGSASEYVANFKYMMRGECYKRTFNNYATIFILKSIKADFGEAAFSLALNSVGQHIKYYESLKHGKLKGITNIFNELSSEVDVENLYPDEIGGNLELKEGVKKQVTVNVYERNQKARKSCIDHYGAECVVCKFDFYKKYGRIGQGFIHVHHLIEVSKIGDEYTVDSVKDLRPVCPNCHAMLHQKNPAYSISELKAMMDKNI